MTTVVAAKSAFLRSQINGILSQPLQISDEVAEQKAPDIPKTVIREVVDEVNRIVSQHNAAAYFPLAIRAVAQQIDQLYWDDAAPDGAGANVNESTIRQSDDLADTEVIAKLPEEWDDAPLYQERLEQLRGLDRQRNELKQRLEQLRQLQALLEPFRDAQNTIQPNLVTRDGEIEKQLTEMKTLATRVFANLANRRGTEDPAAAAGDAEMADADDAVDFDESAKIRSLMRPPS